MELKTKLFGQIKVDTARVIEMQRPILGFERLRRYVLLIREEKTPFGWLQSVEDAAVAFVVVNPFVVKGDYQPVLSDEVQGILGIEKTDDVALLSIVTIRSEPLEVSVNLRAPIAINVRNMTALQTVLEDEAYPVRYLIKTVQERPAEIPQAVSLKISPTSSDNFA